MINKGDFIMKLLVLWGLCLVIAAEAKSSQQAGVTFTGGHDAGEKSRRRRQITVNLTPEDIQDFVSTHNRRRKEPGASNMEELSWSDELAEMGQEWAEGCDWAHGNPDNANPPFSYIGQNLFQRTGGSKPSMSEVVQAWYSEIIGYKYTDRSCTIPPCGHYTQVVWDDTIQVGCGYMECSSFPHHYVVCNYGPGGNYPRQPYLEGDACTQCSSGHQWCSDDLCKAACTEEGPTCTCEAQCRNGGTVNDTDCTCNCADGWTGGDCSDTCEDLSEKCGKGWPYYWCGDSQFPWVDAKCPAFCGYCVKVDLPVPCDADE